MTLAVLFDCDGVLVDSENGLAKISSHVLNTYYKIPSIPSDFTPFIGMGEDAYIGGVVEKYGQIYTFDMKHKIYEEYINIAKEFVDPMPGAKSLIEKLKTAGIKVCVASSADLPKVLVNLEVLGLDASSFDAVITGSDVVNKKPDPQIYLTAAQKCGALPVNCIVVEDAVSGVISGTRADMRVVGLTSSLSSETLMSNGATITVDSMGELDDVLFQFFSEVFNEK